MIIGYIRANDKDGFEGMDEQLNAITEYGVENKNIFIDMIYDDSIQPVLDTLLEHLKTGDALVIMTIDKLGYTMKEALGVVYDLAARRVSLITVALSGIERSRNNPKKLEIETPNIPKKQVRRRVTQEILLKIIDMLKKKSNMYDVSNLFGIHKSTLYHYVKKDGTLQEKGKKLLGKGKK